MTSVVQDYYRNKDREVFTPCKNLKKLAIGEKVMVNWFPPGEQREATVLRFEKGKPIVELTHSHANLTIESADQVAWSEGRHPKKK